MSFLPEPPIAHGEPTRTAVLLVNLGTPAAAEAGALRRYLGEFLADRRVVEIPRLVWLPILHGIILRVRPAKSAAKYASIWLPEGSPLMVHSRRQADLLRTTLAARGLDLDVVLAMRYGDPSVPDALARLRARRCDRLLVVPMYPQFSATTTASVFDAVHAVLARTRNLPEVRQIKRFHDHPAYIAALRASVLAYWEQHGSAVAAGGKLVMSFHGVPRRTLDLGDPYHCECHKTGRLLAESLGLTREQYVVSFQSRFGKAEWLKPYTAPLLHALGAEGVPRVDVICPGFVADCLETLEEIAQEGRDEFIEAGGRDYHYIPCLNDSPAFADALADLVQAHLAGWPVDRAGRPLRVRESAEQAARARELGAGS